MRKGRQRIAYRLKSLRRHACVVWRWKTIWDPNCQRLGPGARRPNRHPDWGCCNAIPSNRTGQWPLIRMDSRLPVGMRSPGCEYIFIFYDWYLLKKMGIGGGKGCFLYVVERCSRRMDIGILLEGWSDCHLSGRYTAEHESRNLCSFVWHWGRDVEFGIFYAILFIMILTSEPRVHTAIIALHGTAGLFRLAQTCPPWRDIDSRAALCPWHPYKMMCCRKSRLRTESNIGSY